MPRIAFISSTFPDYKGCGTGIYAGYLTQALAEQNHEVHVITTAHPEIRNTFGKVEVHKIMSSWSVAEMPKIVQLFAKIKPEIIHINHPTAIAAEKSKFFINIFPQINRATFRIPTILTLHEFNNNSLLGKLKVLPMCLASDAITVTNQRYKESLIKYLPARFHRRVHIVNIGSQFPHNFIKQDKLEQRARFDLSPNDKVIGFLGFITPPKGFENLVEAAIPLMKSDPEIKILAISSWNLSKPAYRQKILNQIEAAGVSSQVIFTGYLDDAEMWKAMEAIDVCAFAFNNPVEDRSSGPLRQALARELPTLVFAEDLNYTEFGLKHRENIWMTPFKDIEALRQDLNTLLYSREIQAQLRSGASRLKSALSFDVVSNSMSRLYGETLIRPRVLN